MPPSLFPLFMKGSGGGGTVTVLPEGIQLTTSILEIALNDAARIVNLPSALSVSLGNVGFQASLGAALQVFLGPTGLTVEICTDG